ncbi:MAG: DUF2062 domain-containing protein [Methylococcales bacterium]|nr:DUF2062 domain-containing protein [Methylococcaceae bacterium]
MPKDLLRKYMPNPETIRNHKSLQFLGEKLHDPNLWHLNHHSVAKAFAIGLFCAWIPTPTQMAFAAIAAFYLRANLPISVALVWITNPLTMPPLYYFAYLVGLSALNLPNAEFSLDSLLSGEILIPFLTGCLILGIICSLAGYFGFSYFWRHHVNKRWAHRRQRRQRFIGKKNPFRAIDWRL